MFLPATGRLRQPPPAPDRREEGRRQRLELSVRQYLCSLSQTARVLLGGDSTRETHGRHQWKGFPSELTTAIISSVRLCLPWSVMEVCVDACVERLRPHIFEIRRESAMCSAKVVTPYWTMMSLWNVFDRRCVIRYFTVILIIYLITTWVDHTLHSQSVSTRSFSLHLWRINSLEHIFSPFNWNLNTLFFAVKTAFI